MKIELKDVSPTQKEMHIEIPGANVKDVYNKVVQTYARAVSIPGFRKGFAPIDVVKVRYKEEIKNEVFREMLPNVVTEAIKEQGVDPLGEPHLHIENAETVKVNGSESITLHVHIEVMPEIAAPKYKGLEGVRRVRPVGEEELEKIIDERRQQSAGLIPVEDRKSKEGDTLIVDLHGIFVNKPEEEPVKVEDLEITLGEAHIEKAFTENLVGLESDEEKEFTVVYPADFSTPLLAGQTVDYKAKVKSVGVVELPEANDDWAKSLEEEFKSMKDLRKKLRGDLEAMAKLEADNVLRDELLGKLIDSQELEIPKTLVDIQAKNLLNNFANNISGQGMDINTLGKDFIKMAYEQMKGQAARDVKGAMLLEKVAQIEKVEVSGDDIADEINKMAEYYRVTPEEVRASLTQQGGENSIADRIRSRKAVEILVDKAKISEGEWVDPNLKPVETPEADEEKPKKKKAAKAEKPETAGKTETSDETKPKKTRKKSE